MTMLVLGGHDRLEAYLSNFARKRGFKLKFINRPTQNLQDALSHADIILVITSLVSHEMVMLAKRYGCDRCIFCKHKGICQIKKQIEELLSKKFFKK